MMQNIFKVFKRIRRVKNVKIDDSDEDLTVDIPEIRKVENVKDEALNEDITISPCCNPHREDPGKISNLLAIVEGRNIHLTWDPVNNFSGTYTIIFQPSFETKVKSNNCSFMNLHESTEYTITIFANYGDVKGKETTTTALTGPRSPLNVALTNDDDLIIMTWKKSLTPQTKYYVKVYGSRGEKVQGETETTDSFIVFKPNIPTYRYFFTIQAELNGLRSKVVYTLPIYSGPAKIFNVIASVKSGDIELEWTKVEDVFKIKYWVTVCCGDDCGTPVCCEGTTWVLNDPNPDSKYHFAVCADNGHAKGSQTLSNQIISAPSQPSGLKARQSEITGKMLLQWNPSKGSDVIYYVTSYCEDQEVETLETSRAICEFEHMKPSSKYHFTVCAGTGDSLSKITFSDAVFSAPLPVRNVIAVRSGRSIVVTWDFTAELGLEFYIEVKRRHKTQPEKTVHWCYAKNPYFVFHNPLPSSIYQFMVSSRNRFETLGSVQKIRIGISIPSNDVVIDELGNGKPSMPALTEDEVIAGFEERRIIKMDTPKPNSSEKPKCVICLDRSVDQFFLPCKHVSCCKHCSKQVTNCPICRDRISIRYEAFL